MVYLRNTILTVFLLAPMLCWSQFDREIVQNSFVALQLPYTWSKGLKVSFVAGSGGLLAFQKCQSAQFVNSKKCVIIITAAHLTKNAQLRDVHIMPFSGLNLVGPPLASEWVKGRMIAIDRDLDLVTFEAPIEDMDRFNAIEPILSHTQITALKSDITEYAIKYLSDCMSREVVHAKINRNVQALLIPLGYGYLPSENRPWRRAAYYPLADVSDAFSPLPALVDENLGFLNVLPNAEGIIKSQSLFSHPGLSGSITWGCRDGKTLPHSLVLRGDQAFQYVWSITWKTILKNYSKLTRLALPPIKLHDWQHSYRLEDSTGIWHKSVRSKGWEFHPPTMLDSKINFDPGGNSEGDPIGGGEGMATNGPDRFCGPQIPKGNTHSISKPTYPIENGSNFVNSQNGFSKIPSFVVPGVVIEKNGIRKLALRTTTKNKNLSQYINGVGDLYRLIQKTKGARFTKKANFVSGNLLTLLQRDFDSAIDLDLKPVDWVAPSSSFMENFKRTFALHSFFEVEATITHRGTNTLPLVLRRKKSLSVSWVEEGRDYALVIHFGENAYIKFLHRPDSDDAAIFSFPGLEARTVGRSQSQTKVSSSEILLEVAHLSPVQLLLFDPDDKCNTWVQIQDLGQYWKIAIANTFSKRGIAVAGIESKSRSDLAQVLVAFKVPKRDEPL